MQRRDRPQRVVCLLRRFTLALRAGGLRVGAAAEPKLQQLVEPCAVCRGHLPASWSRIWPLVLLPPLCDDACLRESQTICQARAAAAADTVAAAAAAAARGVPPAA